MPRSYTELISDDPAWPELSKAAAGAPNGAIVLPPASKIQSRECGILVDHGFVRHLGAGCPRLPRQLASWNAELGISLDRFIIVADDVVGGVFAINGAELGPKPGRVYYFATDSLEWEDTELGHTDFVTWTFEGDLGTFYENVRWPGWENEIAALTGDQSVSVVPPMWTEGEALPIANRDRRAVPAKELWSLQQALASAIRSR